MTAQHEKSTPRKTTTVEETVVVVGRDKTPVKPEDVQKLAQIGCKDPEIADWFGIKKDTLRYNFAAELLKGREEMKQSLRRTMLDVALKDRNVTMLIYLSKNFLGMGDNPDTSDAKAPLPWQEEVEDDDKGTG
jgi:hypothetical protein